MCVDDVLSAEYDVNSLVIVVVVVEVVATVVVVGSPVHSCNQIHRVSKKLCQCYYLNNSVKHCPNLIIFGMLHQEETWRK